MPKNNLIITPKSSIAILFTPTYFPYIIVLVGIVLYVPFLGHVHLFDWDEINFAESAREMIVSRNYLDVQVNYEAFWEKPPLFIWLQVLSMKIFGINEFAARFPNAVIGVLTLLVLYFTGNQVKDHRFGVLWSILYAVSILPFLYFKSGIIDPLFNLCIFLGVYFFSRFSLDTSKKYIFLSLSAAAIGLGILTKGPVALLLFLLTAFVFMLWQHKYKSYLNLKVIGLYAIVIALVGGFWFILQWLNGNEQILKDFITYQIRLFSTKGAGHGGFPGYHFVVVFFGVFPASILLFMGYRVDKQDTLQSINFHLWMRILLWVVLILFSIVSTKIVHYSSMAYFPITYLGAYGLYLCWEGKRQVSKSVRVLLILVAGFWALAVIGIVLIGRNTKAIIASGKIADPFAMANLEAQVHWTGWEVLIGLIFIGAVFFLILNINHKKRALASLLLGTVFFTYATMVFIVPKIEAYSQRAAIEFLQGIKGENAEVTTYGYKSFAHLFYFQKPYEQNTRDNSQLLNADINRKVYVITKIHKAAHFEKKYPTFERLYDKNGFVFYMKKPENDQ